MSEELFGLFQSLDDTPVERENFERLLIPYPGSKARSMHKLNEILPHSDVWVDAFGGSGAVTLLRRKSKFEVFNEKHAGIVAFYRCIRDKEKCQQLLHRLELTVHSREEFIWSVNSWFENQLDDVERAARWYYSLIYSFGRVGRNFGRSKDTKLIFAGALKQKLVHFDWIHDRFEKIQIENSDYRLILKDYDSEEAVIYLDPPYYGKNIYVHNLTKAEHIELCERAFQCKGYVALSGYQNPIYDNFPWDQKETWNVHVTVTTKAITTDTSNVTEIGTNEAQECLWIKYNET